MVALKRVAAAILLPQQLGKEFCSLKLQLWDSPLLQRLDLALEKTRDVEIDLSTCWCLR